MKPFFNNARKNPEYTIDVFSLPHHIKVSFLGPAHIREDGTICESAQEKESCAVRGGACGVAAWRHFIEE